ncbi:hypothetical protein A3B42_00895 [Candidatus Daviesbacteria bacterium RIFCSPLOWO2_01_FULL_38_10]|nr:MAG: hypothetical protein A3D02_03470 [Candidatus Daviesbacteria bacterium RIFCSPHIGHO2_02_FULL_39_41]OGE38321.1 MAG: hypothetical protein A3B42_00895 [Candidatus Daviesbacteria bacterium RIFCSPLOWO2_01_FULL_38_10]OGE44874.1 MAG: hypothetical protein A3E67_00500 [Candidatus Daviesbacteria bacterium RIFCSPHIGHO2_12_FULL_38_25]OGE68081.1 MAG: hypothetical protein A3H81_03740 [Candidatus Daviesbacteria bacterium RIFCSPLOWO2_02_FULL_38_18]OGE71845.1 MAG: hypothetical protein A3H18_00725 [Candida
MRKRRRNQYHPYLKAFSGLSINISAAWFASAFIGTNLAFPRTAIAFIQLTSTILFGIVFLLATVLFEKELEK